MWDIDPFAGIPGENVCLEGIQELPIDSDASDEDEIIADEWRMLFLDFVLQLRYFRREQCF